MKILMCHPTYYGIKYEINPWMNIKQKVNHVKALNQWELLCSTIKNCGAEIQLIDPVPDWPDMVFTANAGMLYKNKIILAHFKYKERQGESPYFETWFHQAGYDIVNVAVADAPFFEGAGDALLAVDKIFAGYGFRTELSFYEQSHYFDRKKLILCELVNPYFYHIDTCFCPLTTSLGIWYPPAFSSHAQQIMSAQIELLAVEKEEAENFACNAIVLDKHVILPTNCPHTSAALEKHGFIVHTCEMTEYLKAGGACKCLTLKLD